MRKNDSQRGFAIAPILYVLMLVGVGGGVLFSGMFQNLQTGYRVSNDINMKEEVSAATRTLSASAVLSADSTLFCPPRSSQETSGTPCTSAPVGLLLESEIPAADVTRLPANFSSAITTGSPAEVGVFKAGSGMKQLDPFGRFYVVCRWENARASTASPAFSIISAGEDGALQTTCGDTSKKGDDYLSSLDVAAAIQRSAVWQASEDKVSYGETGSKVDVDNAGNILVSGNAIIKGLVGVGTLSPRAPLDVVGTAIISGNVGIGTLSPRAQLDVVGSTIISGNVGIGTTAPVAKFYVAGGSIGTAGNANKSFYALGAQSMAVDSSLYSYDLICAGNYEANCKGAANGVVIQASGSNAYGNVYLTGSGASYFNGGNVGIGTTAPLFKVQVGAGTIDKVWNGHNLVVTGTGTRAIGTYVDNVGASLRSYSATTGASGLYSYDYNTSLGAKLILNEFGGFVGIGTTTTPRSNLDVGTDGASLTIGGNTNGGNLYFGDTTGNTSIKYGMSALTLRSSANKGILFYTGTGTPTQQMVLTASGSLGIGTTTPSSKFEVYDAMYGSVGIGIDGASQTRLFRSENVTYLQDAGNAGQINFRVWDGAANQDVRINSSGSLGIGTITPSAKLDVVGSAKISGSLIVGSVQVLGDLSAVNIYGNFVGNVTGDIVGNVTGNVSGTAGAVAASNITGSIATTQLENSGIVAGTYQGITFNAKGIATAASNQNYTTASELSTALSSLTLGTSATEPNPKSSYSSSTGLYSTSATTISFSISGQPVFMLSASGVYNIVDPTSYIQTNVLYGQAAGRLLYSSSTSNTFNNAFGNSALMMLATGNNNIAIGGWAADKLARGSNNVIIGDSAGGTLFASGTNNIAIGTSALIPNSASNYLNIGSTIYGNISTKRIGIGSTTPTAALDVNGQIKSTSLQTTTATITTLNVTTCNGCGGNILGTTATPSPRSASVPTTGLVDYSSGQGITINVSGIPILTLTSSGVMAGKNATSSAIGTSALSKEGAGLLENAAFGAYALMNTTTGASNVAIGNSALFSNTTGAENVSIGYFTGASSNGNGNIIIGAYSGSSLTSGSNNILVGYSVEAPSAAASNYLNIGNTIYGNLSTNLLGIGATNPVAKLDVNGGVKIGDDAATCDSTKAGTFRYSSGRAQLCTGSAWMYLVLSST